jgi:Zn-dependent protease with chaperone function
LWFWLDSNYLNGIILIVAFLLSAGLTFASNWLALITWRRSRDKHWTERARLLYPASTAARSNLWAVPAILILSVVLLWPDGKLLWLFTGIVSLAGAHGAALFFDREVLPRIPWGELLRQAGLGFLMKFFKTLIFICAAVLMPSEFNSLAWSIAGIVLLLWSIWITCGWIWFARAVGLIQAAPPRLRGIVADTSTRMNIPCKDVWLMRSHSSQASAVPGKGVVIFTQRMLEIFSDDELAAICGHELAHLSEPKAVRLLRKIRALTYMPWIFFVPLIHTFGIFPFYGLIAMTIFAPRIYGKLSRKLEASADQLAKANESDAGTYARSLLKIHEDRLIPAVMSQRRARTHPDLYDRLIAVGITPNFPKPLPANPTAWHGRVFAILAGILFAILAIRITAPIMETWGT